MWQERLAQLVTTCHWIGAKGWAPATGGNMSVRQDDTWCWLSESGRDKGSLTTEDFLQVEIATNQAPSGRKPSAETGLHTWCIACSRKPTWCCMCIPSTPPCCRASKKATRWRCRGMKCRKPLAGSIAISIPFRSPSSIMTRILTPGGADCRLCANPPAALRLSAARPRPDLLGERYSGGPPSTGGAGVPVRVRADAPPLRALSRSRYGFLSWYRYWHLAGESGAV